jgi:hypothetical protein
MADVNVVIGSDSVISADSANSIVGFGSNSDYAFTLSRTLKYIYTNVKNDINFRATKQETSVLYDVSALYNASQLSVYEFNKFLESRGYSTVFKQQDGTTDVDTQVYADDDAIKANLYSSLNPAGIKFVSVDWSVPATAENYVITIDA